MAKDAAIAFHGPGFCTFKEFYTLHVQASREENWLIQKHPDYINYRKRVKKLIP